MIETTWIRQPYEQVADRLLEEMRRGELPPGGRLPAERELAARLGVGRAVVREAFGWLQVEGLVETRRGAGSFVVADADARLAGRDGDDPVQAGPAAVLDAREAFEPAVAASAARATAGADAVLDHLLDTMQSNLEPESPDQRGKWSDADRRFHLRCAELTGNPVLTAMAGTIERAMDEPLWRRLRDDAIAIPRRTVLQLAEHRLIAAAIADGDAPAAHDLAAAHVRRARRFMALTTDPEPA